MRLSFRQRNPETGKAQDIQRYLKLRKINPGRYDVITEKLILENSPPREVRRLVNIVQSSLRTSLFSEEKSVADRQKMEFIELTGGNMLDNSAELCRHHQHPEYLNHIEWTARNYPCSELRSKALAHLVLIARDMNSGWYPPQKSVHSADNDVMNIKNILHRSLGTYHSSELKEYIDTPYRIPSFQEFASGIARVVKKISFICASATMAVMAFCDNVDIKKTVVLLGISGAAFIGGIFMNRLSKKLLNESRLMESLIRRALRQQEWDKKVRA